MSERVKLDLFFCFLLFLSSFTVSLSQTTPFAAARGGGAALKTTSDNLSTKSNPFSPKSSVTRYWNTQISNKLPIPSFLLSKASPLSPLDFSLFTKLASNHTLSSHLSSFCSSAGLFCFSDPISKDSGHTKDSDTAVYDRSNHPMTFKGYVDDTSNANYNPSNGFKMYTSNPSNGFKEYTSNANNPSNGFREYTSNPSNGFKEYTSNANNPSNGFKEYTSNADKPSSSFKEYTSNPNNGFKEYMLNPSNGFKEYTSNANNPSSGFKEYTSNANNPSNSFKEYTSNAYNPSNGFKEYGGSGRNVGSDTFMSYRDGANSGKDMFLSFKRKSNSGKTDFVNYGKSFIPGSDSFSEYGKGSTGQRTGLNVYALNTTFKEYTKTGITIGQNLKRELKEGSEKVSGSVVNKSAEPVKFFREKMLKKGTVMMMPDISDKMPRWSFLPRAITSELPFATSKLSDVKNVFQAQDNSVLERVLTNTLLECERDPSPGETKRCVGSNEDMIDFTVSVLGRDVVARTTENIRGSKKEVMIGEVKRINSGKLTKSVSCHQSLYPYLLYYCHSVPKVRVYVTEILDVASKEKINTGVAICHIDTSSWSPGHEAFIALGSGPGQIEVCHWIFENDMTWTTMD